MELASAKADETTPEIVDTGVGQPLLFALPGLLGRIVADGDKGSGLGLGQFDLGGLFVLAGDEEFGLGRERGDIGAIDFDFAGVGGFEA